jgi:hypothetical protein
MNNIPQTNENEKQIMHSVCVKYKFGRMTGGMTGDGSVSPS